MLNIIESKELFKASFIGTKGCLNEAKYYDLGITFSQNQELKLIFMIFRNHLPHLNWGYNQKIKAQLEVLPFLSSLSRCHNSFTCSTSLRRELFGQNVHLPIWFGYLYEMLWSHGNKM